MKLHYNIYLMLIGLLSFLSTNQANAQLKAMPDNYYLSKGASKTLYVINNDNLGACATNPESVSLKITLQPTHGKATTKAQRITYRANPDFTGQDVLKYEITCNGVKSEATIYINIGDKPDFITETDCTVLPDQFAWRIQQVAKSSQIQNSYTTPVAGDVDGDGQMEILAIGKGSKFVDILNANLGLKARFNLNTAVSVGASNPLALARIKINGSYKTLIFVVVCGTIPSQRAIEAYAFDPVSNTYKREWIANAPWSSIAIASEDGANVSIADIDGDGNVELLCGDYVYAAETGKYLVRLPAGGRGLHLYDPNSSHWYISAWGDIDGDGRMEAVCGNTSYKITINDRTDPTKNSATILANYGSQDGFTSLADLDGDGILDVVVSHSLNRSSGTVYAWQGNTPVQIGQRLTFTGTGPSPCCVGDINGDGNVDITFTTQAAFHSYYYNKTTKQFTANWSPLATTDASGMTTTSLFDFNLDGRQEIIYRDQSTVRIFDGVTGRQIPGASFPCASGTIAEGPIIVDDGTGHAAIYVVGDEVVNKFAGTSSSTAKDNNWAPARKVWNQFMYNPTQVNEDLTIPQYPIYQATEVAQRDGTTWQPFNSVLP